MLDCQVSEQAAPILNTPDTRPVGAQFDLNDAREMPWDSDPNEPVDGCADLFAVCVQYALQGSCVHPEYRHRVREVCPLSCGVCTPRRIGPWPRVATVSSSKQYYIARKLAKFKMILCSRIHLACYATRRSCIGRLSDVAVGSLLVRASCPSIPPSPVNCSLTR